jgi:outer membrane protein assembly factor BamE (lipoprotein component of BamABCDE complex)
MFFDTTARVRSKDVPDCNAGHDPLPVPLHSWASRVHGKIADPALGRRWTTRLALAAGLAFGLSGCIGYDGEVVHGYQLDQRSLDQIKVGSSAEQALVVMGYPSTTSTIGGDAWYYITQVTNHEVRFLSPRVTDQHVLAIYFDKQKKVERVANYGIQDGQVFDFVSRTTPTGGSEGNFIKTLFKNFTPFGVGGG